MQNLHIPFLAFSVFICVHRYSSVAIRFSAGVEKDKLQGAARRGVDGPGCRDRIKRQIA